LDIRENRSGNVVVLELAGRLSIGEGDGQLRDRLATLIAGDEKQILVGMAGVTTLDSSGVGELVAARLAAAEAGAKIKLAELSPRVGDVLRITQLIGVFEIFDTLDEGKASFA
jgi:anti-sigma B factor antagonist